jgi:genome maintenance exonuclease 1
MIPVASLFDYGLSKRSEDNGTRHYLTPDGHKVPSVTTILSKSKDMTHLLEWRKRIGDAAADQITKESTGLGSMMHSHLECWIKQEERPGGTNVGRVMAKQMADVIIDQGLSNVSEVWGIEVPLRYEQLWAGTTDLVGVYKGQEAIMDFKTTNKPKKLDHVQDYFLQLTAYIMAHNQTFGTNIQQGVIFMVSRDLSYQEFVLEPHQLEEYEKLWLDRLMMYYDKHPMPSLISNESISS